MSSLHPLSQTRSLPVGCRYSNNPITRASSAEQSTRSWRNELILQRRNRARYLMEDKAPSLTESREKSSYPRGPFVLAPREMGAVRRLYVDQQTGEMRIVSSDRTVDQALGGAMELESNRRFPEKRFRFRAQSETAPRASRSFWDQSLQTKSIPIGSRAPPPRPPNAASPMRTLHLRRSRSAESATFGFETPSRYPRGQQRPSGLASGHQALLLRHKEIVEASRRLPSATQWQHQTTSFELKNRPNLLRRSHPPQRFVPLPLHHDDRYLKLTSSYDVNVRQRCAQEVTLYSKANKKCEEWFGTWLE